MLSTSLFTIHTSSVADIVSEEQRSYNMSRIRSKNTKPELIVRSLLHRLGYRFTVNDPKNKKLPGKQEQMLDSLQRIKQQPLEVGMVKLADRITNLQPPPHYWTKEKINSYREEAQIILDTLGCSNEFLAQRLADKIKNYQQYCL